MNEDIILYLPWPPTVNNYYKTARSGVKYLAKTVRQYRDKTFEDINEQLPNYTIDEPVLLEVYLFPPDRRKRDLDNYMKGLQDAMVQSGLLADDALIDQLFIYRGEVVKGGQVRIEVSPAGPVLKAR